MRTAHFVPRAYREFLWFGNIIFIIINLFCLPITFWVYSRIYIFVKILNLKRSYRTVHFFTFWQQNIFESFSFTLNIETRYSWAFRQLLISVCKQKTNTSGQMWLALVMHFNMTLFNLYWARLNNCINFSYYRFHWLSSNRMEYVRPREINSTHFFVWCHCAQMWDKQLCAIILLTRTHIVIMRLPCALHPNLTLNLH